MIPEITDIVAGLRAGTISEADALRWINRHLELASEDDQPTLRDDFAGRAMAAMLHADFMRNVEGDMRMRASDAYGMAEAMLDEREKRGHWDDFYPSAEL